MTTRNTRSRRLRKKLFLDEFAVQGFAFSCQLSSDVQDHLDGFFDQLIDLVEARDLTIGGGGSDDKFQGYIIASGRYDSTTEEDRKAIETFLSEQSIVIDASVDGLTDAYYIDEDEAEAEAS